jgi:hypothetical protein
MMKNIQAGRVRFATIATLGLSAGLLLAYVRPVSAETPEARAACTHDAFRLCSDAMPDVGRTKACLIKNRQNLSPLCREAIPSGGKHKRHRRRHHS